MNRKVLFWPLAAMLLTACEKGLVDGIKISVRPSGTEPKIKFYCEIKDNTFKCADCYERCTNAALEKVEAIKKSLNL